MRKSKLLKTSAILSYVSAGIYAFVTAWFFSLSDSIYWLFAILGLTSLFTGILISGIADKLRSNNYTSRDNVAFIIYGILNIVSLPSFALNIIAYFTKGEEVAPVLTESSDVAVAPSKLPSKKKYLTIIIVALCLILVSNFVAMLFTTSGFSVSVNSLTLTKEMTEKYNSVALNGKKYIIDNAGLSYAVDVYVPNTATVEKKAPVVFVVPGFTRTKETQAQYCIELSRRGMVVFCLDPGCQGGTTSAGYEMDENGEFVLDESGNKIQISATTQANGLNYLVQYVYNNTEDYNYIDRNKFGVMGHSAGGGNAVTTAANFAGSSYEDSIIKSLYCSGYIKTSAANNYKKLRCNAAMSYAYWDEGSFRYETSDTSFEVIAKRFISEVNGATLDVGDAIVDYEYGNMASGTYRIVHNEKINHCFEVYDQLSITNTIEFFEESLDSKSGISADSQIWWGKEVCNLIALVGAFMLVVGLSGLLINCKFFSTVRGEAPKLLSKQKTSDKIVFWASLLVSAVIACLDYIPLANLSITMFPEAASNTYTFLFPARMINAVMLWAVVNGTIGLIIFFGTILIKNLIEKIRANSQGRTPVYDFEQFTSIKINVKDFFKTLLLSAILFASFYLAAQVSYWLFHQDFRFMMISASPLNWRFVVTWLMYIPLFFIFYISNSIRVNCGMTFENWKEWKVMLVGGLANSIGLVFILIVNYVVFFKTGAVYYGYFGELKHEVWLYVNIVFGLIPMMFLLPIFNRIFHKQTNRVWLGAMTTCMIFIMMTLSGSVTYLPF